MADESRYTSRHTGQQIDDAIDAVANKADVDAIGGAKHVKLSQAPLCVLFNIEAMASCSSDNKMWYRTDGHLYYHLNGNDIDLGTPAYMLYLYQGSVYTWSGSGFILVSGGGADISEILSNDWNDQSRAHVPSARQMNLMYKNMISVCNNLSALLSSLANSSFKTARPVLTALDWVGNATSYSIGYNLTHCHKTDASPTSVAEGDSFTATIVPDAGYTLAGVQATGSGFSQTYDSVNDRINISASNVMNGMTIGCIAATFQVSVGYNLTGFNSESNTTMQSGGSFTKVLSPLTGYSVKTIVITMGGMNITSQVWNASTKTISIPVVTGNIVITATAEETHNIQISYQLAGVTAGSSPTEVEEDTDLEVVLTKSANWSDVAYQSGGVSIDFEARDVLVYCNGKYLERKVDANDNYGDFTATKSGDSVTINVPKAKITGDIIIMNIPWQAKYVNSRQITQSGVVNRAGTISTTTNLRCLYTNNYLPVPQSCNLLTIYAMSTSTLADYAVGCAFYNTLICADDVAAGDACVRGAGLGEDERTIDLTEQTITDTKKDSIVAGTTRADILSFRSSVYMIELGSSSNASRINSCYIYDATNKKYIWFGNSVTKKTNR